VLTQTWGPHRGRPWQSGLWRAELRDDEIADLRHGDALVLRSIRAVVRDRDWGTVPVTVVASTPDVDDVAAVLVLRLDGRGVAADGELRVHVDGDHLAVELSLTATRSFDTARAGLVALHPPQVAGAALTVEHSDGTTERTAFPELISPHQPAFDIAGLVWDVDGLHVDARFSGDTFEMEDQRNWTDASFKTYSRPLASPFPYRVEAGETVTQRIDLTVVPAGGSSEPVPGARSLVRLVDAGRPAPVVGVGLAPAFVAEQEAATTAGTTTTPAGVLLVELDGSSTDGEVTAELARAVASGLPLDVRVVADDPARVDALIHQVADARPIRLGVFSARSHVTEPSLWRALVAAADACGLEAELVGGARSHFTELNRRHEELPAFPAVTISITPQMHARETFQIEESIGMQRRVAVDAARIAGGAPLHVGPVTLRPRFNAVATSPIAPAAAALDADTVDARQTAPQLATWLIASASALAEGGASSVTWFEDRGPRGVEAIDGEPFPVREAMAALHELSGAPLLLPAVTTPDDEATRVLGVRTPRGARLLVARLGDTADDLTIDVDGRVLMLHLEPGTWRALDVERTPRRHDKDE